MDSLPLKIAAVMAITMMMMMSAQASGRIRNCLDQQNDNPSSLSGVYTIYPFDSSPLANVQAYCNMDKDGGGWTVIQRRDFYWPLENFYVYWNQYSIGFGDLEKSFWFGLDNIHALTDQTVHELRVDMEDFYGNVAYAKYSYFYVYPENNYYKLQISGYSGTAGDAMTYASGKYFSARDRDFDSSGGNCAATYRGGWWYKSCYFANPNGVYYPYSTTSSAGIKWNTYSPFRSRTLRFIRMMIRPVN